mmetsp:Transcript_14704/g.43148  ORF Transcript_14704/g.43148 Transcript_14704/m.43148 type:complete len:361 (+) Transcript_14704:742-1824(+)
MEGGHSADDPARVRSPVGREKSSEGGNEEEVAAVLHAPRHRLGLPRVLDEPQVVPHPLDERACVRDAALEAIDGLSSPASLPPNGGEQPVPRGHRPRPGIHHDEGARAVGALRLPHLEAYLAKRRGLLIPEDARDGHASKGRDHAAVHGGHVRRGGHDLREHARGDLKGLEQVAVPLEGLDVHKERAARVGHVSQVLAAARELPNKPSVHGAEDGAALAGGGARARHVLKYPDDLGGREVGHDGEARVAPQAVLAPRRLGRNTVRNLLGARAVPDDSVAQWLPRLLVPDDGGLPLVGDANGTHLRRVNAGHSFRYHLGRPLPDLERVVLHPAGLGVVLLVLALGARDNVSVVIEEHESGG